MGCQRGSAHKEVGGRLDKTLDSPVVGTYLGVSSAANKRGLTVIAGFSASGINPLLSLIATATLHDIQRLPNITFRFLDDIDFPPSLHLTAIIASLLLLPIMSTLSRLTHTRSRHGCTHCKAKRVCRSMDQA